MRSFKLAGLGFLVSALALPVGTAVAQDQEDDEPLEEIITTGSRLRANPNLAAATPVLSVSGAEGVTRGNARIEDFVNVLPQVFANQAAEVSNGASGTAALDLRGLGPVRTLILLDGRRLPYGSSSTSAPNLDIVPMQMIERVDILTGGASAVYGSDAISGVANFVLKRDFEGAEVGVQYGKSYASNSDDFYRQVLEAGSQPVPGSSWDGAETLVYAMIGANAEDGRGNVTVFASYENRNEITQANRIYSGCALGQDDGAESFGGLGCVGSGNYRLMNGGPNGNGFWFQEEDGTMVPWAGGPAQTFNFGPFNFFQRPSERYSIYSKGHYAVSDNLEAFMDISYMNNFSDAQIAPTASFGLGSYAINCDNPYLQNNGNNNGEPLLDIYGCTPQDVIDGTIMNGVGMSHRNVEGGPRNSRNENTAMRIVTGVRGSFAEDVWNWEAFVQGSETRDQGESTNDFVIANLDQALLAVDDGNGNVVCMDNSRGCVPYNIFQRGDNGESLVDPASTAFIHGIGLTNGGTSQFIYGGHLQADLGEYGLQIPWADYGIGFLVGVESRTDKLDARPDEISQVPGGGFTGVGGATLPVAGRVDVDEFYTEIELPLVSGVTGIQELTLRGQYRYSDYETTGNDTSNTFDADAYGLSLAWAPIEDLRFRAQFQRAVRAPNVIELYTGQNTNLPNLSGATNSDGLQIFDPCASASPIASEAQCANTGVQAGEYGNIFDVISGQTQSLTGGNPLLDPETADTVTAGVVWTGIDGLSISIDYFNILVEDAIQAGIPAQTTLDQCLATGNAAFCSLITRGPGGTLASGTPGVGFMQTNINIAELETTGVDLQVVYDFDIGRHPIRLDYAATVLDQLDTVPYPGADPIQSAGFFGNQAGTPSPEYRHRIVAMWQTPWSLDIGATWRYFGETDNDQLADTVEPKMAAVNYLDLNAAWYIMDGGITISGSILNVTGEDPPVYSAAGPALGNGNTYPTVYDTGTVYFASLKYNF